MDESPNLRVVFSGLLLVMLLASLDSTIVATALPVIVNEMGGLEHLSWVVTAYLLAQTVVTPLYGKLGDLYGRRVVLQSAIVLFCLGSALCGMAGSLPALILFRAVQGLGGGGLVVSAQAAVGDVVPPRERGRYQGIFGAVFGLSSVAGPLIGGFFTTNFSWRWIFYVNLPLGLLALAVLSATLPRRKSTKAHRIDFAGAGLLAVALVALTLLTDLGGAVWAWGSWQVLGLGALSLAALGLFGWCEQRASEPVLPLRLFGNRIFVLTSAVGMIVGFAMFGSITYLPLYLQTVKGATPTASGLQLIPVMGGMLLTSIGSGQLISRWGRYKVFPVVGTAVMSAGLFMLSHLDADTSRGAAALAMLVLGMGMGLVMQVLVLAVQNSVGYEDLGVATSGATLFRSIGGSLGTAVLGALFGARLHALEGSLPRLEAFTRSLDFVFLVAAGIAVLAFGLILFLEELPLRSSVAAGGETLALPAEDPLAHLSRLLWTLLGRDAKVRLIEKTAERAGVDLPPAACWMLARIGRDHQSDPDQLALQYRVDPTLLRDALGALRQEGLVEGAELSPAGSDALQRLVAAGRAYVAELLSAWKPEQHRELAGMLDRVARDLVYTG